MRSMQRVLRPALALSLLGACGTEAPPESVFDAVDFRAPEHRLTAQPCAQRNELRQAWFGDLHVHTSVSNDAWSFGVRVDPEGAHRYAFGEAVRLPLGDDPASREGRLARNLSAVIFVSSFLSRVRDRCRRLLTVLTGTSRKAAISFWV